MTFFNYFVRLVFLILWMIFFLNFFKPFSSHWSSTITFAGLLLSILHLSEFVVVQSSPKFIRRAGIVDVIYVLLFGSNYWLPILEKQAANQSANHALKGEDPTNDSK
jgi:uncharacterized protein YhhL (DUF1145 family)